MGATHFLDLAVAPKLPPEWGRFSGTALDRAGHYMLATICYQTFYWTLLDMAGSEIGGGGGN